MLPASKSPSSAPPARALAAALLDLLAPTAWRALHPAERGVYLEAGRPTPLPRLYYGATDGWRAPLLHLAPAPGGKGEPVVLLHTLGLGADGFRYGSGPSLAESLSAAGHSVYLLHHRGDRAALPPAENAAFCFDDIVERDIVAAIQRVTEHAGSRRVHLVGHGLGGQLALAFAARFGTGQLASVAALCAPVRFAEARSDARRWAQILQVLPSSWRLPLSSAGALAAPLVDSDSDLLGRGAASSPGGRVRGVMVHALEDLSVGLLQQLECWIRYDSLVDRYGLFDYVDALRSADCPLIVGISPADRVCAPAAAMPAWEAWAGPKEILLFPEDYGHLDPLLASDAAVRVFEPLVEWLGRHRDATW